MKTLLKTTALLATLTVLLSANLFASPFNFDDELYIDDIPFNTTEIYNDLMLDKNLSDFNFEEEEYINDIPFNTDRLTVYCLYQKAVSVDFKLAEEKYIDDIPFNTKCISVNCLYQKAMKVEFNFEEEEYIDDMDL